MEIEYASILKRVKAAFIDSIVLIGMLFLASEFLSFFNEVPNYIRIILFIFIFLFYDPICVSKFGGTIGHIQIGITVKSDKNSNKNIKFPIALVRFIVKVFLGWISFLTINNNKKRKTIHDIIANSIVIIDND